MPGLTVVDAFGGRSDPGHRSAAAAPAAAGASRRPHPVAVNRRRQAAARRSVKVDQGHSGRRIRGQPAPTEAGGRACCREEAARRSPPTSRRPTTDRAPPRSASGANGYVVVLASVPASGKSRLDALKQFADMQQKYGTVLANKTPDVRETNLGRQGHAYHRLLVGPPGSRAQASALCTRAQGGGLQGLLGDGILSAARSGALDGRAPRR